MDLHELHDFIVRAKKATYVGNGEPAEPSRRGSHDLTYIEGSWSYRDSYFGGTDFFGQEVAWHEGHAVWSMCYRGYVVRADLITPTIAGTVLKAALCQEVSQGRLLDNFVFETDHGLFCIQSTGTIAQFHGRETITVHDELAYALDYFGGLIRD
jgi:Domain of unknown function (DUF5680)